MCVLCVCVCVCVCVTHNYIRMFEFYIFNIYSI